jgi:signal transduction histidine kinase
MAAYGYVRAVAERADRVAQFARQTELTSKAIRLAVENELRNASLFDTDRLLNELVVTQTELVRVRLVDLTGRTLSDASVLSPEANIPWEALQPAAEGGRPLTLDRHVGRVRLYSDILPVRTAGSPVAGVLEVTYLAGRLDADLVGVTRQTTLSVTVLFVVLLIVVGIVLRRLVLRPVRLLAAGVHRVGEGQLDVPVPVLRPDELGHLAAVFNDMATRLAAARQELMSDTERSLDVARRLRRHDALAVAGKLCSSMAHEIGTPLNVIAGRTELVLHALPGDSPHRADLEIILRQLDHIAKIVRAALDPFRRREPGQDATHLGSVLDVVLPLLRHVARRRQVTLGATVDPALPPIRIDPVELQQVLVNLMMNAIEAAPPRASVTVSARRESERERPAVLIAVADTGPGIPADILPRIFEPFFTTKPGSEGTGLGLAVCQDIVGQNSGELAVESKVGVGTTFTVILPEATGATC